MKNQNDLRNKKYKSGIIITLVIIVIFLVCIFSIFDSVKVVGPSMNPNFNGENGIYDKVIISRIYEINYGDVIVFKNDDLKENLIKRVVGVEGDTIAIKDNKLYRNGDEVIEDYICEPMKLVQFNGKSWKIEKGQVFVLGDNRNNSTDSRELGPISKKDILGEVVIRIDNATGKIHFM